MAEQGRVVQPTLFARAPTGRVGWNGILFQPAPTSVSEKVGAWIRTGVEGGDVQHRRMCRSGTLGEGANRDKNRHQKSQCIRSKHYSPWILAYAPPRGSATIFVAGSNHPRYKPRPIC